MPIRPAWLLILAAACLQAGCANYHRFRPTAIEHAGLGARDTRTGDMNDAAVVAYADQTRDVLRKRFHISRNVRQASSTSQILLAGAAGFAGAFQTGARTVAGLAAASAGVPQLGEVFDTGGRAIAYQQAVAKISEAESAYFRARSGFTPVVSRSTLTVEGALLLEAVNGATDAVELFQAGMLPSLEQLRRMEAIELHQRAERRMGLGGSADRRPESFRTATRPTVSVPRRSAPVKAPPPPRPVVPIVELPTPVAETLLDDQALKVTLGPRVERLAPGEAGRILSKHGRPAAVSDQSSKQRLKTFVSEESGESLRALAADIP